MSAGRVRFSERGALISRSSYRNALSHPGLGVGLPGPGQVGPSGVCRSISGDWQGSFGHVE